MTKFIGGVLNVWVYEFASETTMQLTFESNNFLPLWTPDGDRLAFTSYRAGPFDVYWMPADGSTKVHYGMEYEYAGMIALRFGYRSGWDNHNVSWGLGVKVQNFRLDYAVVPFYSELGDTHRVSLGIML